MKVLFVCSGNAFRSPVAEALLKNQRLDIEVDSAGANPIVPDGVAGSARKYLAKVGAEQYLKRFPEGTDNKQLDKYDLIVAMKPEHRDAILEKYPECADKIIIWNVEDPYFLPRGHTEKIFNQIREKVARLADSFENKARVFKIFKHSMNLPIEARTLSTIPTLSEPIDFTIQY